MTTASGRLVGRRVALRLVLESDTPFLLELARSDPGFIQSLSLAAAAGTAELRSLLSGQLDHRIVEPRHGGSPLGYVSAHSRPPEQARVVRVGTFVTEPYRTSSVGIEAGGVFIGHLFDTLGVRRVEGLLLDDVFTRIGSGVDRLFGRDATLREAAFAMGAFRDVHVVSLSRQEWEQQIGRFSSWFSGAGATG